jgi:protein ImuB
MCVRLTNWPIDRIKRSRQGDQKSEARNPKSEGNPKSQIRNHKPAVVTSAALSRDSQKVSNSQISNPIVLVRTVASRQLVVFACEKARQSGIDPGMTLAEAGALCMGLIHQEHQPDKDLRGLHRLARWMVRFTPVVAVEPPDALFLDLTGSERLFHGLDRLGELISAGLTKLGLHFQLAIAETPGAAWAYTEGKRSTLNQKKCEPRTSNVERRTSKEIQGKSSLQLQSSALDIGCSTFAFSSAQSTFARLPISALRLDPSLLHDFHHLGIHTIAQLMQLPRDTIPARFGQIVLHRLDQALGKIPEPLNPIPHSQPIRASIEFEGGIESLTDLWQAFKLLLEQIVKTLRQRSCGARKLLAEFILPGEAPIVKTIALSRPTANLATLWNLLRCTAETVKCGQDGFSGLKLSVPLFQRLTVEQLQLLDQESQAAAHELDHLIERLQVRLGENAVRFPEQVEAHLPEKAVCYGSGDSSTLIQRSTSREMQESSSIALGSWKLNVGRWTFAQPDQIEEPAGKSRPLHLLPDPVEIQCASVASDPDIRRPISFTLTGEVHSLVHCNGPERITGSWWEGRNKTRDYFDAEDQSGQRFWIFRVEETRRWYLHGLAS